MWKTNKWIFIFTTIPLLALGIGFLVFGFMESPEALTDDGQTLKTYTIPWVQHLQSSHY